MLYTDGVSDPGPGPERLPVQALRGLPREADAGQLADRLRSLAGDPGAAQRDDIAILALRFLGARRDRSAAPPREDPVQGARLAMASVTVPRAPAGTAPAPAIRRRRGAQPGRRVVVALGEEAADDVEQLLDAVGGEQDRLIRGDVVVQDAHLGDVQRADLGTAELLDLPVGGQQAGAVGAQLARPRTARRTRS